LPFTLNNTPPIKENPEMRFTTREKREFNIKIILGLCFLFLALHIPAKSQIQGYRGYEHWYIGLNLGTSSFYGDISERSGAFSNINPFSGDFYQDRDFMFGLMLTKKINGVFWTRLNLLAGTMDASNSTENLYFKSDVVEFTGIGMLSLTEMFLGEDITRPINAYAFVGGGIVSYRSWKRMIDTDSLIDMEGAGKRKAVNFVLPVGVGVDYRVTDQFTLTGEFSLRRLGTDRLDAHSKDGSYREGYGLISLGLHYQFEMPEAIMKRNIRHTGKSTDPAIRAYNKKKAAVMKTKGYKQAIRDKRRLERQKREWLILQLFKRSRLDMATE